MNARPPMSPRGSPGTPGAAGRVTAPPRTRKPAGGATSRERLGAVLAVIVLAALAAMLAAGLYHDATTEPTIVRHGIVGHVPPAAVVR